MSEDDDAPGKAKERTRPKGPRKLSPRYLENAALHYLKRFSATEAGLRKVLSRKVHRSLQVHGGDPEEARAWVEALLAKLVRNGLLNDHAFAEGKAQSLRASGRSSRVIAQKLRLKGVPDALVTKSLAEATGEISEVEAARTWARKKRLGPFRADPQKRRESRQKDLAALARAGFDFGTARKVIDGVEYESDDDGGDDGQDD